MYTLSRRRWSSQEHLNVDAESLTEASDQTEDWKFVDLVHASAMGVTQLQPTEAWPPTDTSARPPLWRLQRRATVTPVSDLSDGQQDHAPKTETLRMRRISSIENTPSFRNHRTASSKEREAHAKAFLQYVHEAATTLDKASRERNHTPWWERLLLYLRDVWSDKPLPPSSPSRLLYWHVHALGHEQISATPITNGEYVVACDGASTLPQPEEYRPHLYKVLQRLTHATNSTHERLASPQNSRKMLYIDEV